MESSGEGHPDVDRDARDVAVSHVRLGLELLRSPMVYEVPYRGLVYRATIPSPVSQLLRTIPLAAIIAGLLLMVSHMTPRTGLGEVWFEVGSVLVVLGMILAIERDAARVRARGSRADAGKRRRRLKAALGIFGGACIVGALATSDQDVAGLAASLGVGAFSAVAVDSLIMAAAELLFPFEQGGMRQFRMSSDGLVIEQRNADSPGPRLARLGLALNAFVLSVHRVDGNDERTEAHE